MQTLKEAISIWYFLPQSHSWQAEGLCHLIRSTQEQVHQQHFPAEFFSSDLHVHLIFFFYPQWTVCTSQTFALLCFFCPNTSAQCREVYIGTVPRVLGDNTPLVKA